MVRMRSSSSFRGRKTTSKSKANAAAANSARASTPAVSTTSAQGAATPAVPVEATVQAASAETEATAEKVPDNASYGAVTDDATVHANTPNEAKDAGPTVYDEDSEMWEVGSSVMGNESMTSVFDHANILANAATDLSLDNDPVQIPNLANEPTPLAITDQERLDRMYDEQEKLTRRMMFILRLHAARGIVPSEANVKAYKEAETRLRDLESFLKPFEAALI
ncbi:hypothetical protein BGX28_001299 [Mortierella sp. GBA30]|nr:hypothetical protein BGX28_001299 [Mortierella sp. GBA30]